ncbi:MAG TPA: amidohydrolase family protein [Pseudonocardiaceae bacterium]|jgi:predicted TIM-barrel fold metal-dependent hydrolase|nr:amidohydrolase family protein [Pseudonocardiaceae bacterium]
MGRIDVHTHVVPPDWARALAAAGQNSGGWAIPEWSAAAHLAQLDRHGIDTAVLSLTNPGPQVGTRNPVDVARAANDFTAEAVKDRPDRFGQFATLPQSDVDASLAELARAYDDLHADGIVLLSSTAGVYLGDPSLAPLWDELNRRAAVVFVHPANGPYPMLPDTPYPLLDFTFDTTRTAVNLVVNGVLARCPNVRVILSHAGGYLPYVAQRVIGGVPLARPGLTAESIATDLRRFYFDTALSSAPGTLRLLLEFAEDGHVLFGSDWPFAPEQWSALITRQLDDYPDYAPGQLAAINRGNAEALFPGLA